MQRSDSTARRGRGRTVRHLLLAQRRRTVATVITGLLLLATAGSAGLMLTMPAGVTWPNAHTLRTAGIEVATLWEKSAADAQTMGASTLTLEDRHIAAWLNQLVNADVADPVLVAACSEDSMLVYYRLRLPFGLRAIAALDVELALEDGVLACSIRGSSIGRLRIPVSLWQRFVSPVEPATGPGWVKTARGLVYTWPAEIRTSTGVVTVGAVSLSPGTLQLLLDGVPQ